MNVRATYAFAILFIIQPAFMFLAWPPARTLYITLLRSRLSLIFFTAIANAKHQNHIFALFCCCESIRSFAGDAMANFQRHCTSTSGRMQSAIRLSHAAGNTATSAAFTISRNNDY